MCLLIQKRLAAFLGFLILFALVLNTTGFAKTERSVGTYEYSLKKFRGKQNVLLVFAPTKKNSDFQKQSEILKEQFKFLSERKAALFYVFENDDGRADSLNLRDSDAKDLRKQFGVKTGSFLVVGVDKNGKTTGKKNEPQTLDELKKILKP